MLPATDGAVEHALRLLQMAMRGVAVALAPYDIRVKWLISVEGRKSWKRQGTIGGIDG